MTETFTPAEFSPGFDAQAAVRNGKSQLIPKVCPEGPVLLFADLAPADTTYADVIAAPGAGKKIRLHACCYSNGESLARVMRIRFGTSAARFPLYVAGAAGYVPLPIPAGRYIEGGENEALQASLGASTATLARVTALYTIEDV